MKYRGERGDKNQKLLEIQRYDFSGVIVRYNKLLYISRSVTITRWRIVSIIVMTFYHTAVLKLQGG